MSDILMAQQIRMGQVLKDPIYRKWFAKAPFVPPAQRGNKPWFLYVQREQDGKWARASLNTYGAAYKQIAKLGSKVWDFSITSRVKCYYPPIYRPIIEGEKAKHKVYWANYPANHNWCPYCRRPTLFLLFTRHHAITPIHSNMGLSLSTPTERCSICGIRAEGIKPWMRLGQSG